MLKGYQKQVVVLRGRNGDIFEEAYFILRAGRTEKLPEMLCEANRIVESARQIPQKGRGLSATAYRFIFFLIGLAAGAGLVLLSVVVT